MADKENSSCAVSPPLTRAAAKRAAAVTAVAVAAKRKRVALSAISALPNAAFGPDDDDEVKPAAKKHLHSAAEPTKRAAPKPNPKLKPAPLVVAEDPQLCKHYASAIYSYLRSMEVRAARSTLSLFSLFHSGAAEIAGSVLTRRHFILNCRRRRSGVRRRTTSPRCRWT
jgi:cyclin-A